MMLFVPMGLGVIIGVIVVMLTRLFKKKNHSKVLINSPGVITLLAAIILIYISFVVIRGFEGVAYLILAGVISIFAIISLISGNLNNTDKNPS